MKNASLILSIHQLRAMLRDAERESKAMNRPNLCKFYRIEQNAMGQGLYALDNHSNRLKV